MDSHNFLDEFEEEYDVFYHELKRQVLLLTAEEEEEEEVSEDKALNGPRARKQGYGPGIVSGPSFYYYDWPEIKKDKSVLGLERSGNGTGVFIPQVVQPTRTYSSSAGRKKRRITNRRMKHN
ncbi:ATP-dependent RNA helicase dbp10 [Striga asiatica]|uniref:ATP-dependent RNA helicase dbp10 n=1 Tax=Striga asiatica TaxID=4170 RepID=A0A5A7PAL4_STRAF|nr:ATP-dependent RNA helicase dbp10 [Striga asiatica]